jgi:hypothetical protein
MRWNDNKMYAFPLFGMIGRRLSKILNEQTDIIIVTPVWQVQP